jgi:hypothetical protein
LGGALAAGIYKLLKVLDYEKCNGDQDRDDTVTAARTVLLSEKEEFEMQTQAV